MSCPLCLAEKKTKRYYQDDVCWIAGCSSHPSKKLCVLRRHAPQATSEEELHMRQVMENLFPGIRLRGPASILDHWHLHEV